MFDESKWVRKCPRCGNEDKNQQVPMGMKRPCPHCQREVFAEMTLNPKTNKLEPTGNDLLLYYKCFQCGQRYLIPKLEKEYYIGTKQVTQSQFDALDKHYHDLFEMDEEE